ncbi:GntR family transcriptional regulator [Streptomyces sp. NPDC015414]|uniref:GntR family transcriptional regulator n=1 Tax=Streptomyces sp. NPDC015414 TaxID=3364957 RepID=UPI0036FF9EC8
MNSLTGPGGRLDDRVYESMRDMIVSRRLPAGELVNQSRVSAELGVSRTPLRRAMARLESEGLLVRGEGGWYVQNFTSAEMASIFEIRAVLEGLGCRLAAPLIGRDRLAALEVMFEEAMAAYREGDVDAYYQADLRFHRELLQASGDSVLISTTESHQILSNSLARGLYRDPEETFTEHLAIIEALRSRDQDLAEDLMRGHIRRAVPNILADRLIVPNAAR